MTCRDFLTKLLDLVAWSPALKHVRCGGLIMGHLTRSQRGWQRKQLNGSCCIYAESVVHDAVARMGPYADEPVQPDCQDTLVQSLRS